MGCSLEKMDEWVPPGRGGGVIVPPLAPVDRVILFRSSKALDIKLRAVFGVLLPTTWRWYSRELGLVLVKSADWEHRVVRLGGNGMCDIERLREALQEIDRWSRAYPLAVFPKPDYARARELLEAGGMTLDSISAD